MTYASPEEREYFQAQKREAIRSRPVTIKFRHWHDITDAARRFKDMGKLQEFEWMIINARSKIKPPKANFIPSNGYKPRW